MTRIERENSKKDYESLRRLGAAKREAIQKIAEKLGVTERTVYNWHRQGQWKKIDRQLPQEKPPKQLIKELKKLGKEKRQTRLKAAYKTIDTILDHYMKHHKPENLIRSPYDFDHALTTYLNLKEDQPEKDYLRRALIAATKKKYNQIKPKTIKELTYLIQRKEDYKESYRMSKVEFTEREYIIQLLKDLEKEYQEPQGGE